MKISSNFGVLDKKNCNKFDKKTNIPIVNNQASANEFLAYPSSYYLNFCAGKSLDLEKTYSQLETYDVFPPNIKEAIQETISNSNPNNLKLVDIHKENYKGVLDCDNLEELKFFYPEFNNVLSIDDVDYASNSFIDKFKKGEFVDENGKYILNPNKDLTLQLVQMYYADCLSFTDLAELFKTSPYSAMNKLNIPALNKVYGQYLKLSDEEKNTAITTAISRNNKGKVITQATKDKISSSLKEFYDKNPDCVFNRAHSHSRVFKDPLKSAIFSEVLLRAWGYPESKSLKKALSRFMKKKELSADEFIELTISTKPNALKEFWSKNSWAKEKFSLCMEKSWKRQKELERVGLIVEPISTVRYIPIQLKDEFIEANPEIGELAFDKQFRAVFDRDPNCCKEIEQTMKDGKSVPDFVKIKNISILDEQILKDTNSVFDAVMVKNPANFTKWNIALAHACFNYCADVLKTGSSDIIFEVAQIVYKYVTNSKYPPFSMLSELTMVPGTNYKQLENISRYLDRAWDKVDTDIENINMINLRIIQALRSYMTPEQNAYINQMYQKSFNFS